MIQIQKSTFISESGGNLKRYQREFRKFHCFRLQRFIEHELLRTLREKVEEAGFYTRVHPQDIGKEFCMKSQSSVSLLLDFLANDIRLFELIRKITGCPPIGCFTGRVYRMSAGSGHYDQWHNDMSENRLIGMSINLSTRKFEGGSFELRHAKSRKLIREICNNGFGDAILFRISKKLEHRVADVTGKSAKTAYAGWFRSKPDKILQFSRTFSRLKQRKIPSRTSGR